MCDAEWDWHERSFRAFGALEGRGNFPFANRKSYFLSVISGYNVAQINLFHNNINKQFHMLMFVGLRVKLVGRIMPKFEFNLKVLNASSFR